MVRLCGKYRVGKVGTRMTRTREVGKKVTTKRIGNMKSQGWRTAVFLNDPANQFVLLPGGWINLSKRILKWL
jgi:hypothetical protein